MKNTKFNQSPYNLYNKPQEESAQESFTSYEDGFIGIYSATGAFSLAAIAEFSDYWA